MKGLTRKRVIIRVVSWISLTIQSAPPDFLRTPGFPERAWIQGIPLEKEVPEQVVALIKEVE